MSATTWYNEDMTTTQNPIPSVAQMLAERVDWLAESIKVLASTVRETGKDESSDKLAAIIAADLRGLADSVERRWGA